MLWTARIVVHYVVHLFTGLVLVQLAGLIALSQIKQLECGK